MRAGARRSGRGAAAGIAPGAALASAGIRPSKSRGQNFLVQPHIADRIVTAAGLTAGDDVIEIGPGLGILSERIAQLPIQQLRLIELDSRLAEALKRRLASTPKVGVIEGDFLELAPHLLSSANSVKVIGNLPFSSAAAILRTLCESRRAITRMVLMFQREVGERIRARPGDPAYSALSVIASLYWTIDSHFRVAAGSFHPRPKVNAEVLVFSPLRNPPFEPGEEESLLDTIRAAFSSPRKTLRNALSGGLRIAPACAEAALARARINPGLRAETLDLPEFVLLSRQIARVVCDA